MSTFGRLFSRTVDGYIYAQPLYVPNLTIQGKTRNVVYVATEHNSVYAFDADDPTASAPLWQVNLGTSVPSQDICVIHPSPPDCPYLDLIPEIGITGTPVIDTPTAGGTMYVVARTKNTANGTYHVFLHALDITSGAEKFGGPVEITGQVPGTGTGSSGGILPFDPLVQNQRPGLLLMNGIVYVAFGSVGDIANYHGWVFGYNASTLQQVAVFNVTPNGYAAGIWGGGQGPATDGSNIYLITADGLFDADTGGKDYGDSFLKLSPNLSVLDYFTPYNQATLDSQNIDLGSAGVLALPGTSLIVGMGKDGVLRLVDTNNMRHFNSSFDNIVQEFTAINTSGGVFIGAPIYWNSPNFGPVIYLWGPGDYLKAFKFTGTFQTSPVSQSSFQGTAGYSNAVPLSLSANGNQAGTGIVWASAPYSADANTQTVTGILRAFDATNLSQELWNSQQNLSRDDVGNYAKFNPPTIANGKVYLGTFSGQLLVYGLNPPAPSGIQFVQVAAATPQSATSTVSVPYSGPQTAGNLNIVVVGWNDATSTVQSVTDSAGNAYSLAIGPTTGTNLRQSIYYAKNIIGGSTTVTVTFNQSAAFPDIRALEYSGIDPVSPLDVTAGASGNSATANSGSATTTAVNELIFGANMVATLTQGPGANFTSRIITVPDGDIAEDQIVSATGAYSATAPLSPAGPWVMQMATFKAGGTPNTAPTVSGVAPGSGPIAGGTAVTITGTNFVVGATVTFGGTAATGVNVTNSTSISATTPAHAAGAVNVVVTNPDTQSGTLTNGFTYTSPTAPTVSAVAPGSGPIGGGTAVTITGTNFVTGATVSFGGTAATGVNVTNSTSISATTPAHTAGAVTVVVTNPDGQSGPLTNGFTYNPPPTVTSVAPSTGPIGGGTAVTITGTNFVVGATVSFGGTAATGVNVTNSTSISATTPAHAAGAVNVVVTNPDTQSGTLTNGFTYSTATAISFVQVAAATPQSSIQTVPVTYLAAQRPGNLNIVVVGWNDTTATVQSVADNRGNAYSLAIGPTSGTALRQSIYYAKGIVGGATTVTVTFSQPASYPDIRILEYAGVGTLDKTAAASGSSATANSGSATTTAANELIFGANMVATLTQGPGANFTSRIITTPDGDMAEDRIVTATGTYSATSPLTSAGPWVMQMATFMPQALGPAPTVGSVSPNTGPIAGGTAVTITGTNFVAGAMVTFGTTPATILTIGPTSITATTPAHAAGAVNVVIMNPDGQSGTLTNGFTYIPPPTVSSVAPGSGPIAGGTAVTITGTNFVAGAMVTFGGTAATGVTVGSSSSITATTPAHTAGAVNVVVTNPDTQNGTLTNGFTYTSPTAPTVSAVAPGSGPIAGGTAVTITGTNFVAGAMVTFGGTAATGVNVTNSTSISATTPAHTAGAVTVVVTNPDTQNGTLTNGFTYNPPPTVTSVAPSSGLTSGGTAVTITGTNFVAGAMVTFGGTAATGVNVTNSTSISATTPAHTAGAVNVVVTNPDTQNGTLTNGFTYTTSVSINFVQVAAATPQSPTQTVPVTYPLAQTPGNLNIVVVGWNDTTATVQSVADNRGNAYSLAIGPTSGTALRQSIYYAKGIVGGATTVTVTFSQPASYPDIRILEYAGVGTLDKTAAASGSSATANSGSATTTAANELIFGANMVWTSTGGPGSGFTSRIITTPDGDMAEDRIVTATGTYSATSPLTSAGPWVMQMATFK